MIANIKSTISNTPTTTFTLTISPTTTKDPVIMDNECDSKGKPNLFRLASPDELNAHKDAIQLLSDLNQLDKDIKSPEYLIHFKKVFSPIQSSHRNNVVCVFLHELELLKVELELPLKKRVKKFRKMYNIALNKFYGILVVDSVFNNILPINDSFCFQSKRVGRVRTHTDFTSPFGDVVGQNGGFVLHTRGPKETGGGRTEFDSSSTCLMALRAGIEASVKWDDIESSSVYWESTNLSQFSRKYGIFKFRINFEVIFMSLKIRFPGTKYWEKSDSPRIRHILCGGNPPKKISRSDKQDTMLSDEQMNVLYPDYAEFLCLVKKQILQIIRNSTNNPNCVYSILPCCRISPVCNKQNLVLKDSGTLSKRFYCRECNLDLCAAGCGRIYHGDGSCEETFDEASEALINKITKSCSNPNCRFATFKDGGCNHMTCTRCSTQWCWVCGLELPRNENGRYSTDLHYRINHYGIGVNGGCHQF
jgi:hypothetical protein